jgi:hypothetical protein
MENRGIVLLFSVNLGTRWGRVVNTTPRLPGKDQYPLYRRKIAVLHHKCMGVPYRVNDALGDSIFNSCIVGKVIQKWKSVNCLHV